MTTKPVQAISEVQYYLDDIAKYDKAFQTWSDRVDKIIKKYRDDNRKASDSAVYNILWSNVQTLKSATFARLPKPDVSRRFRDNDPVGRVASLIVERALDYEINHYPDYRETLNEALGDRFLGGRGTSWVRYEPKFKLQEQQGLPEDGYQITEDQESEGQEDIGQMEILDYECAPTDYVHWKDFGHSVCRTWEEVTKVWRKVYMTRQMLRERFPDIADKIPLDSSPDDKKIGNTEGVDKRALIYEIWDKETGEAVWISKTMGQILDKQSDPLELEGFFPCPKPLFSTLTNDTLVPVPDYAMYQDQAQELDVLSDRIWGLIRALQVKGVFDASIPELARLFTEGDNNTLLPVKNWAAFAEKQGLKGAIDLVDIKPIAEALNIAYQAMQQVKNQIYDITGISDIVRGQSVASETATAQQIKGQYASLRLKSYQDEVARFATDMLRLKAQIICKHFDPETILQISAADQLSDADKQLVPQAMQLLQDEPLRSFRVDIVADSMVLMDEQQEKQNRVEFLTAVGGFLEKAIQAGAQAPQLVPVITDLLKFGVTGFRAGKAIEGQIDQAAEQLKQQAMQPKPPQPNPDEIKAQAAMQAKQMDMAFKEKELNQEAMIEQFRQQQETQRMMMQQQFERVLEEQRLSNERAMDQFRIEMDIRAKHMLASMKPEVNHE